MSPEIESQIINRLRSAEGHLKAVRSMVETGWKCDQVLHQLNAVQGALSAVARMVFEEHLQENEMIIKNSDCRQERTQALDHLTMLYQQTFNK